MGDTTPPPAVLPEVVLPRMRVRRGRVMHQVRQRGGDYVSVCTRPDGGEPRARAPIGDWTQVRSCYDDCQWCPSSDG